MKIDPNKLLPKELVIPSAEDLLYSNGLCPTSVREWPKRKTMNSPKVIAIFLVFYLTERILDIFIPEEEEQYLQIIGETGHYFGMKFHFSLFLCLLTILNLNNQIIFYYNYKRGKHPTFLRVFQMMSGSVTPMSVGLFDELEIRKFCRHCKTLFKMFAIQHNIGQPTFGSLFVILLYITKEGWKVALLYGLPNAAIMFLNCYYSCSLLFYSFLYFYIICKYLRIKIRNNNKELIRIKKTKQYQAIREILRLNDTLYREIEEYNDTYWSKFLLNIWSFFGSALVICLFIIIFGNINQPLVKISIVYFTIISFIVFNLILSNACSVNIEAFKTYNIFNSIVVEISRSETKRTNLSLKYKVNMFSLEFSHYLKRVTRLPFPYKINFIVCCCI